MAQNDRIGYINFKEVLKKIRDGTMSGQDDEIKKLKDQVQSLTGLVGVLSEAFDKMSVSQSIISGTVDNLVEAQDKFSSTLESHKNELGEIKSGVNELLRRLPPPKDND